MMPLNPRISVKHTTLGRVLAVFSLLGALVSSGAADTDKFRVVWREASNS